MMAIDQKIVGLLKILRLMCQLQVGNIFSRVIAGLAKIKKMERRQGSSQWTKIKKFRINQVRVGLHVCI